MQDNTVSKGGKAKALPGQVVLVLQGGGALGSYQAGVYQALHEAGIEPDWIIGTSIGAINASLIAGNEPEHRLARLQEFWKRMEQNPVWNFRDAFPGFNEKLSYWSTVTHGIPGFFRPNPLAHAGDAYVLGPERAGYYSTDAAASRRSRNWSISIWSIAAGRGSRSAPPMSAPARCAISTAATARSPSSMSWRRARCRRPFRRCGSTASCTGTAASSPTRRRRRCSTTIRARTR